MSAQVRQSSDDGIQAISNSIVEDIEAMFALSSMLEDRNVYDLDTLGGSESTTSLRTLQDPHASVLSTGHNSVVDAFLSDSNGLPILTGVQRYRSAQKSRPPLSGIKLSRIRSAPTPTNTPPTKRQSFVTNQPTVTVPLATLCDLIDRHEVLERVQIINVEIHKEWSSFGSLHRFLVMHLRRPQRADVYARLDRRNTTPTLLPKLMRSKTRSSAADTMTFASAKSELLHNHKAKPENRLVFSEPSTLRAFRFFVTVISDELRDYHVWPENSWQLCTLTQEYLASASKSQFVYGTPLYFGLTRDIRTRIYNRIYHVPQGATMTQILQCISLPNNSYWRQTFLPKALIPGKQFDTIFHSHQTVTVPDQTIIDIGEVLRVLSSQALDPNEGSLLASRATALYRQMALYDPDKHTERYIASLTTHADCLLMANRPGDACDVLRQVVQMHMLAYERYPRASNTKLANSIRAYAKQVSRAGPTTRDCRPFQDLLDTYQELYKRDPDKWYKELDESVGLCIDQILKSGRVSEALSSSVLLVELYRVRYDASPRAHWAGFAAALQAYTERLFRVRRVSDAIETAAELMRTYRTLWRSHPKIPRNALAQSMEAYSQRLFRVRRGADACGALLEIVEMYRSAYASVPEKHHMSLAESLNGYADGLTHAGRVTDACTSSQEIVDMYRKHLRRDSITFHAHLARALAGHSARLHSAGRDVESWAMRVEIVDVYRELDRAEPGVFHREIAAALNACADDLTKSGRVVEACDAALEIVEYYRAVSGTSTASSAAGFAELSRALTSYADRLQRAERYDEACAAVLELVELDRRMYARYPAAHAWQMAASLDAYAARLAIASRVDEACNTSLESIGIDRQHKTFRPNESETKKAACFERVYNCCQYMVHLERYLEVLDLAGEALETLRTLKSIYSLEELLQSERHWMETEETKLRKLVQEMLHACNRQNIRIPSQSYPLSPSNSSSDLPNLHVRRSSTARRPRLGWEINRWRAQKAAEGRRAGWYY